MMSRPDRRTAATIVGAAAVGVLAWPSLVVPPSPGLDPSFIAGLHLAGARGMDVGTEIISTYGPLGFLSFPQPIYGFTSALALLHTAAIHFALVGILVHRSAALFPLWAALVLSFAGAQTIRWLGVPEMALALATIVAILLMERAAAGHPIRDWSLAAGALCVAILGLGKLNTGAVVVAISIITVAAIGSRRQLLIYVGLLAASAVALWFAAGQGVGNLVQFVTTSASMTAGFNAAMGLDQDQTAYWMVAAAGVATAALVYARFGTVTAWPIRLRVALAVVLALVLFITFKASFVRWHFSFVFATLVLLAIATFTPRLSRQSALLAVAVALVAFLGATKLNAWSLLDPTPGHALSQRHTLFATAEMAEQTRRVLAAAYAVDGTILGRMRGQPVHIAPLESGLAFAHDDLDWTPLPVFQDYHVFTPALDEVNRQRLLDADDGPRFILRGPPAAIDGRYPWFEGPASMRAMLCLYEEAQVEGGWQLLERGRDRCAEPHLVSRVETELGTEVPVPEMDDGDAMMFVRIHGLEPSLPEAAMSFLFKAHEWYITRDEMHTYRLVAPTASQGLLMAVGPALSYAGGFEFGPAWRSVSVAPGPRSSVAATTITLEFWGVGAEGDAAD